MARSEPVVDRTIAAPPQGSEAPPHRAELRLQGIVGSSDALTETLRLAALAAPLDVTLLLTGASGTGKSQLARIIHDSGPRARRPFMEINCAALPEPLIENELFGAAIGGHSTAREAIPGKLAAADGGTLLLDEIAELPLGAQAKLLQLLQAKLYYPLGSARAERADVRLIGATNRNLEDCVRSRTFREDLFYRLQVLTIRLPSLAERRSDVPALARRFRTLAAEEHDLDRLEFSDEALSALQHAPWPGNVRQLGHCVESALIRAAGERATRIECRHVLPGAATAPDPGGEVESFREATRHFQRDLLQSFLERNGWNVTETARRLDLTRSHVYNLIHSFGLERARTLQ